VRPKRALRREDLPTLERPRKATSGCGLAGRERKVEAEKRKRGGVRVKKVCAYFRAVVFGGSEMEY